MKKPAQHLIAEVPRRPARVEMTIGIDLGDVWGHYCTRTARLIKGARLMVVKDAPHCITWTHADEANAELLSFLGEKAFKSKREVA